jgi:uncharacterized membrane protein
MQTKKSSLIEAIVNTAIGFFVTWIVSPLIYWAADVQISIVQMGVANVLFTILSIARNYIVRRWFNKSKPKHTFIALAYRRGWFDSTVHFMAKDLPDYDVDPVMREGLNKFRKDYNIHH